MSFQEATKVPVVLREEDGALCAYFGQPDAHNPAFLIINTEVLNAAAEANALTLFRDLATLCGAAMQKALREEMAVELVRDSMPKGPAQ
jgi:hypothetical protein